MTLSHRVTVVTPTIPPRRARLVAALESVAGQTFPVAAISVACDLDREGAAVTRDRAVAAVQTEWIAFLDDDDYLYTEHLQILCQHQSETGADVVVPWFNVGGGGTDPFPDHEMRPWKPAEPYLFPITALVRTDLVRQVGGFHRPPVYAEHPWDEAGWSGEDWPFWCAVNDTGAQIDRVYERTWCWMHWSEHGRIGNTSGRPDRW